MSAVLVASPSAFLRIALIQQVRRRHGRVVAAEAATAGEAANMIAGGGIDLAIVDNVLIAAAAGDSLIAAIERHCGRALVVTTHEPKGDAPAAKGKLRVITGVVDGRLDLGAVVGSLPAALDDLALACSAPTGPCGGPPLKVPHQSGHRASAARPELILVAASTGGPSALTLLLRRLGPPRLPVVVALHMPADQTAGFARHLGTETGLEVIERGAGEIPPQAQVIVLRGGSDYRLARGHAGRFRLVTTEVAENVFHPSADLLFGSAAEAGIGVIAAVLSGMGEDGARGAAAVAAQQGRVLAQDFASCVVAGMPQATAARCPSAVIAGLPDMAERLSRWSMALLHRAAIPAVG